MVILKRKRGRQRKTDNFNIEKAVELYNNGTSMTKIAKKLGTNYSRIRRRLIEKGVILRRAISRKDINWCKVIEEYKNLKSLSQIAKEYGCSVNFLSDALQEKGIKIRSSKEQVTIECKNCLGQHWYVNEQFFDNWSHEMAYVLGWIFTDGNIPQKENMFRITSTDIEHLQNIADLFTHNAVITVRKWNSPKHAHYKPAGTLSINRAEMVKKLKSFGLKPAKSKDIKFPNIPKEFLGDFIRGVFEGDGSIGLREPYKSPKINFCSGSRDFIIGLAQSIKEATEIESAIDVSRHKVYGLNYYSSEAVHKLFRLMYSGVPENMILQRKYNRFLEYFAFKGVDISV